MAKRDSRARVLFLIEFFKQTSTPTPKKKMTSSLAPRLRHVMLLSPDVRAALQFWGPGGLGLGIVGAPTERWATLRLDGRSGDDDDRSESEEPNLRSSSPASTSTSSSTSSRPPHPPPFPLLAIKHADGAAQATSGHSPFLAFEVQDLQASVEGCLRAGGRLDGAIRHGVASGRGSVAAVVAPGGQMVSLFERG